MAVFYSFHYERDAARVQQIMQMGAVGGQTLLNSQEWETVRGRGNAAVEEWIDAQMKNKSAVVVLIGAETAGRRWVNHEIIKAWNEKRPLLGIEINRLAPLNLSPDPRGANPFAQIKTKDGHALSEYLPIFTPTGRTSADVYNDIRANLSSWVARGYVRS
ncbi:TIR domain-containing protein [Microbacterium sp. LMI12-1-1.1]|uniref:TIR domain-containing protein n=1 Tax=Microbacterium sp. LMI12-1-1.1 TaxID=3135225 RepID=UPI0034455604